MNGLVTPRQSAETGRAPADQLLVATPALLSAAPQHKGDIETSRAAIKEIFVQCTNFSGNSPDPSLPIATITA
jgi:hypothetical protein